MGSERAGGWSRLQQLLGVCHPRVLLCYNQAQHFGEGTRLSVLGKLQDRGGRAIVLWSQSPLLRALVVWDLVIPFLLGLPRLVGLGRHLCFCPLSPQSAICPYFLCSSFLLVRGSAPPKPLRPILPVPPVTRIRIPWSA